MLADCPLSQSDCVGLHQAFSIPTAVVINCQGYDCFAIDIIWCMLDSIRGSGRLFVKEGLAMVLFVAFVVAHAGGAQAPSISGFGVSAVSC